MLRLASSALGAIALGAIAACHTPDRPATTAKAVAATRHARALDAIWMIELPAVTVEAPGVGRATTPSLEPRWDDTVPKTTPERSRE